MRQHSLFPAPTLFHGGELSLGKRKTLRPLASKRPLHLVLKSRRSLWRHRPVIEGDVKHLAKKFGLRLYSLAVAHDHAHLLVKVPGRREYHAFIRSLTGLLARKLGRGLWRLLPFTRIANWGKDFIQLKKYLEKNRDEAAGLKPYEPRVDWYRRVKQKERKMEFKTEK
jgi:hypothetical protein